MIYFFLSLRSVSAGEQDGRGVGERQGLQQERRAVPGGVRHLLRPRHQEHADVRGGGEGHGEAGGHARGQTHSFTHLALRGLRVGISSTRTIGCEGLHQCGGSVRVCARVADGASRGCVSDDGTAAGVFLSTDTLMRHH